MRRPLAALAGLAAFAGCGAGEVAHAPTDAGACPEGVAEVRITQILPEPPPGTELVAPDAESAAPFKTTVRKEMGDHLRSVYSRVVVKRGREIGTGVFVVNADERFHARDVLLGADAIAEQVGSEPEKLTIAGQEGAIVAGGNGFVASGVVGDCSQVTLVGQNEAEVRAVAAKVRRAG